MATQATQAATTRSVWVLVDSSATIGAVPTTNPVSNCATRPPPSCPAIREATSAQPSPADHCSRL
ncbi:MAG: hypothetical protein E6G35_14545 [Actinobacteria bacterium]|nr:MAG: hypothetical protein E6G35_14545 [Actinomycetota bacterium]